VAPHTLVAVGGTFKHILENAIRQGWQAGLPLLLLVNPHGGFDPKATTVAFAGAFTLTAVKAVAVGLSTWSGTDPVTRAAVAFFGVLAGVQYDSWASLAHENWTNTLYGAGVAAVLSLGAYYLAPPAVPLSGSTVVVDGPSSGLQVP
jgi:hypothetical protein